jgi:hypothetical protein
MRFSLILIEIGGLFMRPLESLFFLRQALPGPGKKGFASPKKAASL